MNDTTNTPAESKTRERILSFTVTEDGTIRAEFSGATAEGVDPIIVSPDSLPQSIQILARNDGIIGRLRRFAENGETAAEKAKGINEGLVKLYAGEWKLPAGRPAGEGGYTLLERAAHEYKLAKAAAKGETYDASLAETAAELEPLSAEWDAVSEAHKDADAKVKAAALAGTKLGKLKATTLFAAAWAKVKAEEAARQAAKAAEKAKKAETAPADAPAETAEEF